MGYPITARYDSGIVSMSAPPTVTLPVAVGDVVLIVGGGEYDWGSGGNPPFINPSGVSFTAIQSQDVVAGSVSKLNGCASAIVKMTGAGTLTCQCPCDFPNGLGFVTAYKIAGFNAFDNQSLSPSDSESTPFNTGGTVNVTTVHSRVLQITGYFMRDGTADQPSVSGILDFNQFNIPLTVEAFTGQDLFSPASTYFPNFSFGPSGFGGYSWATTGIFFDLPAGVPRRVQHLNDDSIIVMQDMQYGQPTRVLSGTRPGTNIHRFDKRAQWDGSEIVLMDMPIPSPSRLPVPGAPGKQQLVHRIARYDTSSDYAIVAESSIVNPTPHPNPTPPGKDPRNRFKYNFTHGRR